MSQHAAPIVPTVLFVADQRHPWRLAELTRFVVTYHTPTTVRVGTKGGETGHGTTRHQHQVYCLPDDAAWQRAQRAQAALQQALDGLAAGLRALGSYASRLSEAGGMKGAPNPLCPTVISAADPDDTPFGYAYHQRLVPHIERRPLTRHTPKMLRLPTYYDLNLLQAASARDHFVCPDDAAWAVIEQLIAAAQTRAGAWEQLLKELGTYSEALADGRYAARRTTDDERRTEESSMEDIKTFSQALAILADHGITPVSIGNHLWQLSGMTYDKGGIVAVAREYAAVLRAKKEARSGVRPAKTWSETDLDTALVERFESAGYHWEMAKQTPDGHWHHVISARNTALLRNDQVLLRRERVEALLAPDTALPPTEEAELIRCEAIIERGVQTFIEVGEALQSIRNGKLYRAAHKTFDDYCRDRWGIGASRARQLIGASEVAQNVESVTTVTLSRETHARPLVGLAPDQQIVAAQRATTLAGDTKPTARHFQQAAAEIKPKPAPQPTAPLPDDLVARAKRGGLNVWIDSLLGGGYQTGQDKGAANYTTYATLADLEAAIARREATQKPNISEIAAPAAVAEDRRRRGLPPVPSMSELVGTVFPSQPAADPRVQIAALLIQIAPLIVGLKTDDQEGLSQAIADLNECQEGTEAAHWLNVGWVLLDLVHESEVAT